MIIIENNKVAAEKLINKSTKLKDLEKTEYFQKFYELDPTIKRYPDNPKFLLTLIKWFLEDPVERQYNLIKVEFETYLEQVRLNYWKGEDIVIKDIAKFPKFRDFATEVHRITSKYRKSDSQEQSDEVKDIGNKIEVLGKKLDKRDVTLQKDDVVVVRADTMQKSIEYGSGFSAWCTARPSNNYFYEYRFGNYGDIGESTMYYVYLPKRYNYNPNDNDTVLHFGVNDEGQISYTDRSNRESVESLSWLQDNFEEFDGVNMAEVFPHKPITSSEKKVSTLPDDMSDEEFYKLSNEDKLMYLQSSSDRVINLNKFKSMSDDLKSNYFGIVENSGLKLDRSILYIVRNTTFGRRYIKNMSDTMLEGLVTDLSDSNHTIFRDRQKAIEIIDLIVENKKDTISPRGLYDVLCASYAYGNSFDEKTFLSTVNKFGKSKLTTLSPVNIRYLITDFAYYHKLPLIEDVLGKEIISKLTKGNVQDILDNADANSSQHPDVSVDLFNFVVKYFGDVDNIVSSLLSTALSIKIGNKPLVDFNALKLKLIDSRKVFSSDFVTNILDGSYNKSKMLAYIGDRFDINNLTGSQIVSLFRNLIEEKSRVVDLEKAIGGVLPKLTNLEIHSILSDITSSTIRFDIVDLLIKYTIKNWQSYSLQVLLTKVARTNNEKIKYINILGRDYLNRMLTKENLLAILESSSDPVSIIELFGKESVLSKLEIWEFKKLLNTLHGNKNKTDGDVDKLVSFIVNNFQVDSEDIVFLFQSTNRPEELSNLIGSVNVEKLSSGDIISIVNNRYIDSVVQDKVLELFKDKILKFTPEQINLLLDYSTNALPNIVDFLSKNNYSFTNSQIVTIFHHISIFARQSGEDVDDVLTKYAEKIGVDKIKNLDNKSILYLYGKGFRNFEFLLRYIPIESLDGPVIEKILTTAYKNSYSGQSKQFERVFQKLESVLPKLSELGSDGIVSLMSIGYDSCKKFFDYFVKKNPSMLTPSLILSFLRSLIDDKVFKNTLSAPEILEQIGTEKINNALNGLSEKGINALFDNGKATRFSSHVVHALLSIMSPSNMSKINDNVFYKLVYAFGFISGRKYDEFAVLLKKPNLTNSNLVDLIKYAPDDYYKFDLLESIKPQLNKLTPDELVKPLTTEYFYNITTSRLIRIVNFYGKTNTDRLTGDHIFNVLRQIRYDANEEIMFKLLLSFGENLYKLTNNQIELLSDNSVNPNKIGKYAIEMATFCTTKKMSEKFINQIRESDYTFLQDFTGLYFKNFNDVTDYLRVIAQYIKTHNNTLTFPEFVGIVDKVESVRSVRNAVLTFLSKVLKGTFKTYWKKYQDLFKHNNNPVKEYKRFYSDLLLENSPFSQKNLEKALDIERKAYPPHMQLINSYIEQGGTLDIYDIADYLECEIGDIVFHMGSNWFIIGCVNGNELEIADWASDGGMSLDAIKAFFGVLLQYKGKTISCSARETTSYRLIKQAERVGYVTVLEEEEWNWGGVKMVDMKFKFNDDFMNRLGKK